MHIVDTHQSIWRPERNNRWGNLCQTHWWRQGSHQLELWDLFSEKFLDLWSNQWLEGVSDWKIKFNLKMAGELKKASVSTA